MAKKYNWAILGCGNIAKKFSTELKDLPNANLYATASRNIENAQNFATEFGFQKAYGSYQEMVEDPKVDVVYIATPHNFHLEHSLLCLKHKKAVLCEKALAINTKEVAQMINASKENNTFLIHGAYLPYLKTSNELKTKPVQHSVKELQGLGIKPDMIVTRNEISITNKEREKISMFCNVPTTHVVESVDLPSVYEVPFKMKEQNVDAIVANTLI